jgi:hypothetical protein
MCFGVEVVEVTWLYFNLISLFPGPEGGSYVCEFTHLCISECDPGMRRATEGQPLKCQTGRQTALA